MVIAQPGASVDSKILLLDFLFELLSRFILLNLVSPGLPETCLIEFLLFSLILEVVQGSHDLLLMVFPFILSHNSQSQLSLLMTSHCLLHGFSMHWVHQSTIAILENTRMAHDAPLHRMIFRYFRSNSTVLGSLVVVNCS